MLGTALFIGVATALIPTLIRPRAVSICGIAMPWRDAGRPPGLPHRGVSSMQQDLL